MRGRSPATPRGCSPIPSPTPPWPRRGTRTETARPRAASSRPSPVISRRGPEAMPTPGRPGHVLLGLGLLVGCHWSPPPGQYPGAMLTVRVQGTPVGWAKVRVDGAQVIPLRSVDADEVDGALAVTPGVHRLELRSGERILGQTQVDVGHFEAAQVLFFQPPPAANGPSEVQVLVSPVTSAVARQSLRLRTGASGDAARWSASPGGCGTFAELTASGATFVPAHAGTCRVSVAR